MSGMDAESIFVSTERLKGLALAKAVRGMTQLFIALSIVGCVIIAWAGRWEADAIGFAIGLGVIALFQCLLILMVAQYIIARLDNGHQVAPPRQDASGVHAEPSDASPDRFQGGSRKDDPPPMILGF